VATPPATPIEREYLTVVEAAYLAGLGEQSIRRAIKAGRLPASKPAGTKRVLIRREDLVRHLEGKSEPIGA
jgi:excisionase family DNA binding protein